MSGRNKGQLLSSTAQLVKAGKSGGNIIEYDHWRH